MKEAGSNRDMVPEKKVTRCLDKELNKTVLKAVQSVPCLIKEVRKQQSRFVGHEKRENRASGNNRNDERQTQPR